MIQMGSCENGHRKGGAVIRRFIQWIRDPVVVNDVPTFMPPHLGPAVTVTLVQGRNERRVGGRRWGTKMFASAAEQSMCPDPPLIRIYDGKKTEEHFIRGVERQSVASQASEPR